MEGLTCLFRVLGGVQESYAVCQSLQYDDYVCNVQSNVCILNYMHNVCADCTREISTTYK